MFIAPSGRKKEADVIHAHISESIENRRHGLLYVSGMPGSGKTHTCKIVLDSVKDKFKGVQIVFLNCGALVKPGDLFLSLHDALTPNVSESSPRDVQLLLRSVKYTVILADEIDMLIVGPKQHILYNFLELPQVCKNVYIICISNTYNMPNCSLQHKIRSRLGWNRLNFQMYQKNDIVKILQETEGPFRLTPAATDLCAAKVASLSGDIRKAFEIRKMAVRIAEKNTTDSNKGGNSDRGGNGGSNRDVNDKVSSSNTTEKSDNANINTSECNGNTSNTNENIVNTNPTNPTNITTTTTSGLPADIGEVEAAIKTVFHSIHHSFVHFLSPFQRLLLLSVSKTGPISSAAAHEDLLASLGPQVASSINIKFQEFQEIIKDLVESGILRKKQKNGQCIIWTEYIPEELEMILGEDVTYEGIIGGE